MLVKNGVVSEFIIGFNDNKMFTSYLVANLGEGKQGFGGIDLSKGDSASKFIAGILNVVGVPDTVELESKAIRVYHNTTKIQAIGNFLEDKWLDIDTLQISPLATIIEMQNELEQMNNKIVDDSGKTHYSIKAESGEMQ